MKTNAIEVEVVALIGVARVEVERLEGEERAAGVSAAKLQTELHELEQQHREATEARRRSLERKAEKLADPGREARDAAARAQLRTLDAKAELAKLRGEASGLRRFIIDREAKSLGWASGLGEEVAAAERAVFNREDGSIRKLRPLRRRAAEVREQVAAAVEAEATAQTNRDAAREDLERIQHHRTREDVMAEPVDAVEVAKARLDAAVAAAKAAAVAWCEVQAERFRVRRQIEAEDAGRERTLTELRGKSERLRATLREGLLERERVLEQHRQRLFDLTGSAEAEVSP